MELFVSFKLNLLFTLASSGSCWEYFTKLTDLQLSNSLIEPTTTHSEYIYGDCRRNDIKFYCHVHLNHIDVLGKPIVRNWIDVPRIPTCIRLRATAYEEDTFRSTAWPFQMCVPRISYCHSRQRILYHYYEFYIPSRFEGGMNWDIYFFGPVKMMWW